MHHVQNGSFANTVSGAGDMRPRSAAAHRDGVRGMKGIPRHSNPETGIVSGLYRNPRVERLRFQADRDSEQLIASMPLPDPFDFDQLVGNIAAVSGRQIVIRPIPDHLTGLDGLCGLLVKHETRPVDLILHHRGCSPPHELQLKVHQLVHLWAGDNTATVGPPDVLHTRRTEPDGEFPMAGPSGRDELIELRADNVARLIGERSTGRAADGYLPPAEPVTPGARSRRRPGSPPSSRR